MRFGGANRGKKCVQTQIVHQTLCQSLFFLCLRPEFISLLHQAMGKDAERRGGKLTVQASRGLSRARGNQTPSPISAQGGSAPRI